MTRNDGMSTRRPFTVICRDAPADEPRRETSQNRDGTRRCRDALQDTQQVLARHALLAVSHIVVMTELLLQDAVDALGLLASRAAGCDIRLSLHALLAGLARRVVAALDRALLRVAAIALKEKLRPFTTAQTAVRSSITSHNS